MDIIDKASLYKQFTTISVSFRQYTYVLFTKVMFALTKMFLLLEFFGVIVDKLTGLYNQFTIISVTFTF